MFEKIKRNLFKFFNKKNQVNNDLENIESRLQEVGNEISESSKLILESMGFEIEIDPKERLRKRLNYIIKNAKSFRIRKKNIRRIEKLDISA